MRDVAPRGPKRGIDVSQLEAFFTRLGADLSKRLAVRCTADVSRWPRLVVRFGEGEHHLLFYPSRKGQGAYQRLPGFDVSYERQPDQPPIIGYQQEKMLLTFLVEVAKVCGELQQLTGQEAPHRNTEFTAHDTLWLLSRCNLRCFYCGNNGHGPEFEMSLKEVSEALLAFKAKHGGDLSKVLLTITGGEPTLSRSLPNVIRLAKHLGYGDVLLTTNGLRLADALYADSLAAAGLSYVELSLRSMIEESYDFVTGTKGLFPKAMAGLANCVARFDVLANLVINRTNYKELPELAKRLSAMQTQSAHSLKLMPSIVLIENPANIGVRIKDGAAPFAAQDAVWKWSEVSVPNAELIPYLAQAVAWDHTQSRRIFIERFDGLCYAPICAGRKYPSLLEHAQTRRSTIPVHYLDTPLAELPPENNNALEKSVESIFRVKAQSCHQCRYDAVCPGIALGNAVLYGFEELIPFKQD